jgi:hypothetical protein
MANNLNFIIQGKQLMYDQYYSFEISEKTYRKRDLKYTKKYKLNKTLLFNQGCIERFVKNYINHQNVLIYVKIQGVSKKPQPRNFPRNRHCFKDKRF